MAILLLARFWGEAIILDIDPKDFKGPFQIVVKHCGSNPNGSTRFGFDAPKEINIAREELLTKEPEG